MEGHIVHEIVVDEEKAERHLSGLEDTLEFSFQALGLVCLETMFFRDIIVIPTHDVFEFCHLIVDSTDQKYLTRVAFARFET